MNENKPEVKTKDVAEWSTYSYLPLTLLGGTRAMHEAGDKLLFRFEGETEKNYENRLKNSTLTNAYRKTCNFLAGQIFQESVVFDDKVPDKVKSWTKHVDIFKNNINVFCKRNFFAGVGKGVSHILIDTNKVDQEVVKTKADEDALGLRPYFKDIPAENVVGGRVSEDGHLEQFRYKESVLQNKGKYGTEEVERIRVFNSDGSWEVLEKDKEGVYVIVDEGILSLPIIPIVTFIPGQEKSPITGETPLMDLAEHNLEHFRSSSDQRNILHIGRVPILFGKHLNAENIAIGSSSMITTTEDAGDMKFVEITGAAISAGRVDIQDIEAKMAMYGLQQLAQRSGGVTATEKAINTAESNSSLGAWASEYEDVLTQAFSIAAKLFKIDFPEDGLSINKEFDFGILDIEEISKIVEMYEKGLLSAQSAFTEVRRRGFINEQLMWEDVEAELENESRNEPDMGNLAGTAFGGDANE